MVSARTLTVLCSEHRRRYCCPPTAAPPPPPPPPLPARIRVKQEHRTISVGPVFLRNEQEKGTKDALPPPSRRRAARGHVRCGAAAQATEGEGEGLATRQTPRPAKHSAIGRPSATSAREARSTHARRSTRAQQEARQRARFLTMLWRPPGHPLPTLAGTSVHNRTRLGGSVRPARARALLGCTQSSWATKLASPPAGSRFCVGPPRPRNVVLCGARRREARHRTERGGGCTCPSARRARKSQPTGSTHRDHHELQPAHARRVDVSPWAWGLADARCSLARAPPNRVESIYLRHSAKALSAGGRPPSRRDANLSGRSWRPATEPPTPRGTHGAPCSRHGSYSSTVAVPAGSGAAGERPPISIMGLVAAGAALKRNEPRRPRAHGLHSAASKLRVASESAPPATHKRPFTMESSPARPHGGRGSSAQRPSTAGGVGPTSAREGATRRRAWRGSLATMSRVRRLRAHLWRGTGAVTGAHRYSTSPRFPAGRRGRRVGPTARVVLWKRRRSSGTTEMRCESPRPRILPPSPALAPVRTRSTTPTVRVEQDIFGRTATTHILQQSVALRKIRASPLRRRGPPTATARVPRRTRRRCPPLLNRDRRDEAQIRARRDIGARANSAISTHRAR